MPFVKGYEVAKKTSWVRRHFKRFRGKTFLHIIMSKKHFY